MRAWDVYISPRVPPTFTELRRKMTCVNCFTSGREIFMATECGFSLPSFPTFFLAPRVEARIHSDQVNCSLHYSLCTKANCTARRKMEVANDVACTLKLYTAWYYVRSARFALWFHFFDFLSAYSVCTPPRVNGLKWKLFLYVRCKCKECVFLSVTSFLSFCLFTLIWRLMR